MDWHNHDKDIAYRRCRYFILLGFCFTTEIKSLHELTLVNLQLLQPASPSQQWPCNANPDVLRAHNTGGKWWGGQSGWHKKQAFKPSADKTSRVLQSFRRQSSPQIVCFHHGWIERLMML